MTTAELIVANDTIPCPNVDPVSYDWRQLLFPTVLPHRILLPSQKRSVCLTHGLRFPPSFGPLPPEARGVVG